MIKLSEVLPEATDRQREVCALLMQGLTDKHIARELGISPKTINHHRCDLLKMVKVSTTTGLIYKMIGSPEVVA